MSGKRLDWQEVTEEHVTPERWLCNCSRWHPAHDGADPVRVGAERLADDMELLCRIIADEAPSDGAQINRAFHAETGYWPADSAMAFRDQVLGANLELRDLLHELIAEGPIFWRCVDAVGELSEPDHPPRYADVVRRIRDLLRGRAS